MKYFEFIIGCGLLLIGCQETKTFRGTEAATTISADSAQSLVEVTGQVQDIQNGKDGYTATLVASDSIIYMVTISIPNMKDVAAYRRVQVGETITVRGESWTMENRKHITVRTLNK